MNEHVFVEGDDNKFICDLLAHLNLYNNSIKIETLNGWTNLFTQPILNILEQNSNKGIENILICDADENLQKREKEILGIKNKNINIQFNLFLITSNSTSNSGKIEDLLLSIINNNSPSYSNILHCFDQFIDCTSRAGINYPNELKSKFFAFTSATGQGTNLKKINFRDTTYFDLDNTILDPLKFFLRTHISL